MDRLQPGASAFAVEAGFPYGRRADRKAVGSDHLARLDPRQHGGQRARRAFFQLHSSGRDVDGGNADPAAHVAHRRQPVGVARIEQRFLGQRACRHQSHDVARDQRFRNRRAFAFGPRLRLVRCLRLLRDGDPASCLDQPCQISFGRMYRHAAHGHRLPVMLAPAGQRDVENLRRALCIFEEQLEEIAHPIEQQRIGCLRFQPQVLRHHRRNALIGGWGIRPGHGWPYGRQGDTDSGRSPFVLSPIAGRRRSIGRHAKTG